MAGQVLGPTRASCELLTKGATSQLIHTNIPTEWFENRLADLNLWAAGLGVFKTGHASLEYRLRLRPDVYGIISELLEELQEALAVISGYRTEDISSDLDSTIEGLLDEDRGVRTSSSSSPSPIPQLSPLSGSAGEEDDDQSFLVECKRNVDRTLDQLTRISVLIRKSGSRLRHQKADIALDFQSLPDDLRALRDGLTEIVLLPADSFQAKLIDTLRKEVFRQRIPVSVLIVTRAWFLKPTRLTRVQDRLIRANIRRQNRFLKAKEIKEDKTGFEVRQEQQLLTTADKLIPGEEMPRSLKDLPTTIKSVSNRRRGPSEEDPTPSVQEYSQTATDLGSQFTLKSNAATATMSVDTRTSAPSATLDYPRPPPIRHGRVTFQCPYCQHTLPQDYTERGGRKWRNHVKEDLEPYICVFPDCPTEDVMYVSSEDWIKHTKDHHANREWICPICDPEESFEDITEFYLHMRLVKGHADEFPEHQLLTLGELSWNQAPLGFKGCPLCRYSEYQDSADENLRIHIAEHIHAFALISLPWKEGFNEQSLAVSRFVGGNTNSELLSQNDIHESVTLDARSIRVLGSLLLAEGAKFRELSQIGTFSEGAARQIQNIIDYFVPGSEDSVGLTSRAVVDGIEKADLSKRIGAILERTLNLHETLRKDVENGLPSAILLCISDFVAAELDELVEVRQILKSLNPSGPEQTKDQNRESFKIVVAIDLGNAYSKIAWGTTDQPDNYELIKEWPGNSLESEGVPTTLIYDQNTSYRWGYQIRPIERKHEYFMFPDVEPWWPEGVAEFTSRLRIDDDSSRETIVVDYVSALKRHSEKILKSELGDVIVDAVPMEYVLTVPVWWHPIMKHMVGDAMKIGLADMATLRTVSAQTATAKDFFGSHSGKVGQTFVFCDAGAIAVQVSTYTVLAIGPEVLFEETDWLAGACGSAILNFMFEEHIKSRFSKHPLWEEKHMKAAVSRFEEIKKRFSVDTEITYSFPAPGLPDSPEFGIFEDEFEIEERIILDIFEHVTGKVVKIIEDQVTQMMKNKRTKRITGIVLRGGFSESRYLQKKLQKYAEALGGNIQILKPSHNSTTTVRGAIKEGLRMVSSPTKLSTPEPKFKSDDKVWVALKTSLGHVKMIIQGHGIWDQYEQEWKYQLRTPEGTVYRDGKLFGEDQLEHG